MWKPSAPSWQSWRRTGALNVLLIAICEIVLLICFLVSVSKRDSSSISSTRIYEGPCGKVSTINTVLHLGLNIISTGILASSNFFMQIVTSPSRKEIDRAHIFLRSLKIGLQSPTNILFLSRTKQICWVVLFMSSIPIHLFFNSSIYNTAYQSLNWNVTIATNHFVQNGTENQNYWLPGASLAVSGSSSPVQTNDSGDPDIYRKIHYDHMWLPGSSEPILGFGNPIFGYWNPANNTVWNQTTLDDIRQQIATTALECHNWTSLTSESCMEEFRPYKFHTDYKNVVIVVSPSDSQNQGWRRDQVFDISLDNLTKYWDSKVPPDVVNSLWSWTPCTITDRPREGNNTDYIHGSSDWDGQDFKEELRAYDHTCGRIFGLNTSQPPYQAKVHDVVPISFSDTGTNESNIAAELSHGYKAVAGARDLQIDHCLAEPVLCQVRISRTLIQIVLVCVLVKIVTSLFLLLAVKDVSLVTPGDAIESFISDPDLVTKGLGSLALSAAQSLENDPREVYSTVEHSDLTLSIRPRRWVGGSRRVRPAVYRAVWVQAYYPIFLVLVALLVGVIFSGLFGSGDYKTFGRSQNPHTVQLGSAKLGFLATLIVVNMPQVLLSFVYLTINTLYTQLQVEQEWNSYARDYAPLRVSYPTGEQTTTYRLQLPYKYSIPLIVVSILLHWIVSNSVFLLLVEGITGYQRPDLAKDLGVSSDAMIAIAISPLSILVLFCLSLVFVLSPFFFISRKLRNDMVAGATNSLVLSAACHIPNMSKTPKNTVYHHETFSYEGIDDEKQYLIEVARGKVRWGAMSLPPDLAANVKADNDEPVMHLGFGTEEHNVQAPQTGTLYA